MLDHEDAGLSLGSGPVDKPAPTGRPAWWRFGWLIALAAGLVVIGVYYTLPRGGIAAVVVLCSVNAFAAAGAFCAAARSHGLSRVTWFALAGGMTLSTSANVLNYGFTLVTGRQIPFPSPLDAVWLMTYPCFMLALFALARHQRGADHVGQILDAAILVVGGGTLWWVYVMQPSVGVDGLSPFSHVVSVLFPVMDVLTFAMLIGLVVSSRVNPSMRLLVASFTVLLASDSLYAIRLADGSYHTGGPNDALWMLSYLLLGVAALHTSARAFPHSGASTNHRLTLGRLVFLGAALLIGPILLYTHRDRMIEVVWPSFIGFMLVMGRLGWINRQLAAAGRAVEGKTEQLRYQALHDALSGLPNRALVMDRIEQMLTRNRRYGTSGAALFMDLDDFKNVNDTLGHQAGDRLLVAVAARLGNALRDADTIARMGGDEFVVLIDGTGEGGAEIVAQRLLVVMREPFDLEDAISPLMVNISIGIAGGDRARPGDLLRDADVALYQAKARGKNRYEIFNPEMQSNITRRTDLEFDLRSALAAGQYRLVYQPIYNLGDLGVIGVEALLRWDHPTRGVISPAEFIPILEQTGQICEVGRWVLRTACVQMAAWHARGDTLEVSVNVSGRQLDHDDIVDDIREALATSGLPAAALIIEVTETALMVNAEATARRLRAIKEMGVRIAVDDFGTGYSSLAYLRQFPVDSIKIDRAFTNAVTTSPESRALINTLVQLGKDLGLTTLAEGVETTDEMDLLRLAKVNQAQGYLMAHPLDPETLETHLLAPTRVITPSTERP